MTQSELNDDYFAHRKATAALKEPTALMISDHERTAILVEQQKFALSRNYTTLCQLVEAHQKQLSDIYTIADQFRIEISPSATLSRPVNIIVRSMHRVRPTILNERVSLAVSKAAMTFGKSAIGLGGVVTIEEQTLADNPEFLRDDIKEVEILDELLRLVELFREAFIREFNATANQNPELYQ